MWENIKKRFLFNEVKLMKIEIPARYSVKILKNKKRPSYIDKKVIKMLLNFTPNFNNLKCEINRWDNYVEYMENIRAYIYCEAERENWNHLGSQLIELEKFIECERKRDMDDFNSFLHLIEVEEEEHHIITDVEVVEKTIFFINDHKRDYQNDCSNISNIYINLGCNVNDYQIIWGEKNYFNLIVESYS